MDPEYIKIWKFYKNNLKFMDEDNTDIDEHEDQMEIKFEEVSSKLYLYVEFSR